MSAKSPKKGLGRGFASLIPTELLDESFDPTAGEDERISDLRNIKISEITADPDQPRRFFDQTSLNELAASVKEHGVIQPIVVTSGDDGYVIVAGERRFRAAQLAGLDKLPALVRTLSGQHRLEISLIENLQRRDLNVLETATAYLKLRDQFNLTLDEIGKRVGGKSVSAISNTLRLLRLPDSVKTALRDGVLKEGQARPLIGLDEAVVSEVLPQIIKDDWSARRVEQFIVQYKQAQRGPVVAKPKVIDTEPYEDDTRRLAERLAAKVDISTNARGGGKIVIKFKDASEYERISKLLS